MKNEKFNLEDRLLEFAANIIRLAEKMPNTRAGAHLSGQLLRSGTSPLLNHGESEAAESRADFVHKLKLCLQELKETWRCLRLIALVPLAPEGATATLIRETDELIRIFMASIRTAQAKLK